MQCLFNYKDTLTGTGTILNYTTTWLQVFTCQISGSRIQRINILCGMAGKKQLYYNCNTFVLTSVCLLHI